MVHPDSELSVQDFADQLCVLPQGTVLIIGGRSNYQMHFPGVTTDEVNKAIV